MASKTFDVVLLVPGKTFKGIVADSYEDAERQVGDDPLVVACRKAGEGWMLAIVERKDE